MTVRGSRMPPPGERARHTVHQGTAGSTGDGGGAALPAAHIAHLLPGRVRLVIAGRQGDPAFFDRTATSLQSVPGVTAATGNPVTGSLLVEHTLAEGLAALGDAAEQAGLFRLPEAARGAGPAPGRTRSSPLDLVSTGFAGLGAFQVARGNVVGNAVENLWNAYGAAVTLRQPLTSAALVGLSLYQILNGQFLGSGASLLFYALSARHMAHTGDPEAAG